MENASKALLIAGAILIVIVLISIGMLIVQSSRGILGEVDDYTSQQSVQAFNSKFLNYQGIQKGASVKTLLQEIATSNSTNTSGHVITVKLKLNTTGSFETLDGTNNTNIIARAADVVSSARYKVTVTATDESTYIKEITIERQ